MMLHFLILPSLSHGEMMSLLSKRFERFYESWCLIHKGMRSGVCMVILKVRRHKDIGCSLYLKSAVMSWYVGDVRLQDVRTFVPAP